MTKICIHVGECNMRWCIHSRPHEMCAHVEEQPCYSLRDDKPTKCVDLSDRMLTKYIARCEQNVKDAMDNLLSAKRHLEDVEREIESLQEKTHVTIEKLLKLLRKGGTE